MRPGKSAAPKRRRGTTVAGSLTPVECSVCFHPIAPALQARAPRLRGQLVHPACAPGGDDS